MTTTSLTAAAGAICLAGLVVACGSEATEADTVACEPGLFAPGLDLGTIPPRNPEDGFRTLVEGEAAPLEFGSQASWMLVLSIRVADGLAGELFTTEAWIESKSGARLSWRRQELKEVVIGADGGSYLTNMFLPLEADDSVFRVFGWDGQFADIHAEVQHECGEQHLTRTVRLALP